MPTFICISVQDRYKLRGCMVAPTKIIAGIGMSLGLTLLPIDTATGKCI